MRRRAPGEKVDHLRLDRLQELLPLARKMARWAKDHLEELKKADPTIPEGLHDRAADNWRPLLAIADIVGRDWPIRGRTVAQLLTVSGETESPIGELLLKDIRVIFERLRADRLPSVDICRHLESMEERPWREWKRGRAISPNRLGRLLSPFGIHSRTIRLPDGSTPKGYPLQEFEDAFRRYIAPNETPQRHNPAGTNPSEEMEGIGSRQEVHLRGGDVADQEQGDLDEEEFLRREREAIQEEGAIPPASSQDP
jgi:hypothetical protein